MFNERKNNNSEIPKIILYPCRNYCCSDEVTVENTYFDDCNCYVKECIKCNIDFSENNIEELCFTCRAD